MLQQIAWIAAAASASAAAVGFLVNAYNTYRSVKQARASLVNDVMKTFISDAEVQRAFYEIEYDEFVWPFPDRDAERRADKLLRLFANLAIMAQTRTVFPADLAPFAYYFVRVASNDHIREYIRFLGPWSAEAGARTHPFGLLLKVADEHCRASRVATKSLSASLAASALNKRERPAGAMTETPTDRS